MAKGKKSSNRRPTVAPSPVRSGQPNPTSNPGTNTNQRASQGTLAGLIIALIAFFLYAPSLRYGYVLDDSIVYTNNQYVQKGWGGLREIFTTESFSGFFGEQQNLLIGGRYRPLSLATFALEKAIVGQNPAFSHLINLLLYALLGWLCFHSLRRIFPPEEKSSWLFSVAGLASLLYLLHPLHSEVVANIKGRDEILAALGGIGALYASWRYAQEGGLRWMILSAISFWLGLLAKENTLTFVALIPLTLYYFSKITPRRLLTHTGVLVLLSLAYLALRYVVVGQLLEAPDVDPNPMNDPFVGLSSSEKYATILLTLGWYLKLLVVPYPLTHDYYPYHVPVVDFGDWRVLLSLLLMLGLSGLAIWSWKKRNIPTYAAAFYLITLSIVSNLAFTVGTFMNERFVFISSLGFCLVLAWLIVKALPQRLRIPQGQSYPIGLGLIAVLSLVYAGIIVNRLPDWKSETSLNESAYRVSTGSARAKLMQAATTFRAQYAQLSDPQAKLNLINELVVIVEEAVRIVPNYRAAWDFRAGLAGERYNIDRQLAPMLEVFTKVAIAHPDARSVRDFMNYVKPSSGPVPAPIAEFAYKVGYLHFAKKAGDLENAKKYLKYGIGNYGNDPRIDKARSELKF